MPSRTKALKDETFTFRLEPRLKAALIEAAADEHKQPGELIRGLLEAHIAGKERRVFEAEARRQCLAINARARTPDSDEAAVLRELGEHLDADAFADEWRR